jgi:beta-N-acetylhexosaminidase
MAGQRVIFSYPGLTVPSALLQQITAGEAAGVVFFGGNISSEAQITSDSSTSTSVLQQ